MAKAHANTRRRIKQAQADVEFADTLEDALASTSSEPTPLEPAATLLEPAAYEAPPKRNIIRISPNQLAKAKMAAEAEATLADMLANFSLGSFGSGSKEQLSGKPQGFKPYERPLKRKVGVLPLNAMQPG